MRTVVCGEGDSEEARAGSLQGLEQAYIFGRLRNVQVNNAWDLMTIVESHTPLSSLRPSSDLAKNSAGKLFW